MNNKGFIVSTILYTILIAFLLFLGVTLSIFSSATSTVGAGTKDLVNSEKLTIKQLLPSCEPKTNILAVITSKYGEFYWPKDFPSNENHDLKIKCSEDGNIYNDGCVQKYYETDDYKIKKFYLKIEDIINNDTSEIYFEYSCK